MNTIEELWAEIRTLKEKIVDLETKERYISPWVDYSGTSVVTGWASFTLKKIFYKNIEKLVFVRFNIVGTSNSTAASFTFPLAHENAGYSLEIPIRAQDNGAAWIWGVGQVGNNWSQINLYKDANGAGWTATGTKGTEGEFWYRTV